MRSHTWLMLLTSAVLLLVSAAVLGTVLLNFYEVSLYG